MGLTVEPSLPCRIDEWLETVRVCVARRAPELLVMYETYASEARFGRTFIDSDLSRLPRALGFLKLALARYC